MRCLQVRARGTRRPAPNRPDTTLYDFEEVEQFYPDYLRKRSAAAAEDYGLGGEVRGLRADGAGGKADGKSDLQ